MGDMTQETRDELLMAVAEALTRGVPAGPDVFRHAVPFQDVLRIEELMDRANHERHAPKPPGENSRDALLSAVAKLLIHITAPPSPYPQRDVDYVSAARRDILQILARATRERNTEAG